MGYLDEALGTARTPQSEAIPGSTQVANNAGGFAWSVDDWTRVQRFLILGSEGGTYYQSERELTRENIAAGLRLIKSDGEQLVNLIVDISVTGRAPKPGPAIFLLAAACAADDLATRKAAFAAIKTVCRTGTHLFTFCRYVEQFRGWGRGLRSAVGDWYFQDTERLALQAVKYRQREGWTHRDVLRLTHPKTRDVALERVWRFMLNGKPDEGTPALAIIVGFAYAQESTSPERTAELVRNYRLPREAVKPEHLSDAGVWEALLTTGQGMPVTAMVRNLGNMSKAGLLGQMSAPAAFVCDRLRDERVILKSLIHPIQLLAALTTYTQGHGMRSSGVWPVNPQIVDALNDAFYLSFDNVVPSGKPQMLAIDVSGSMDMGQVSGVPGLTPRAAAAAMALVTASVEPLFGTFAFSDSFRALDISKGMRLDDVMRKMHRLPFSSTDCALPMIAATQAGLEVDTFVIYTDSETWAGAMHPKQALDEYRAKGPGESQNAKVAVVGMTSSGFSIADPADKGMLDLVGFDTATPNLLAAFSRGEI